MITMWHCVKRQDFCSKVLKDLCSCYKIFQKIAIEDLNMLAMNLCAFSNPEEAGFVATSQANPTRINDTHTQNDDTTEEGRHETNVDKKKRTRARVENLLTPTTDGSLTKRKRKRQKQVQVELGFNEDENLDAEETQEIEVGEEETN